ncbi:MAG: DUF3109 family protein [Candidatus Kapabacteria bacterium]|jgi:hypothetical protein|nr:DUF3109 family protein [Candidatus Kapabacteria bacterium]
MISIDHLLLDEAVLTTHFACDLGRCKGACCTLPGGYGAPLADAEVEAIRQAVPAALPYLSERNRAILAAHDPVDGHPGHYTTRCIDDADCVFVAYTSDGVATCSIEKAWHAGESAFRKPLSCHLFPIRIAHFGGPYLHYEQFDECEPGRQQGEHLQLPLVESLREPLIRAYGEETYQRILDEARTYRKDTA